MLYHLQIENGNTLDNILLFRLKMTIRPYKDRLPEALKRDGAHLVGTYSKIIGTTEITFECGGATDPCGIIHVKSARNISIKGGAFCQACASIKEKERAIATNMKNRGTAYPQQCPLVREKTIQKSLEMFGTENPFQSEVVKERSKQTNQKKLGVDYPQQNKDVRNKTNETCIERYGVKCSFQSTIVREHIKNTNIERYGVENPNQNSAIRQKIRETNIKKYGYANPMQNPEIRAKAMKTSLDNCGFEHALQNPDIMERQQKNSYSFKDFVMPSGAIRKIQGYERFALNTLIGIYSESQIKTGSVNVPRILYKDNGKNRYHYPDIWIPHANWLIEVKSTQTYYWHQEEVLRKKKACEEQGYVYEIWCYNEKGQRIDL
jgi:hypothetical protein